MSLRSQIRFRPPFPVLLAVLISAAWAGLASAADSSWEFGVSQGVTDRGYVYRHVDTGSFQFDENYGRTGSTFFSAARRVAPHFAVTLATGYLSYGGGAPGEVVAALPGFAPLAHVHATVVPVALALRFDPVTRPGILVRPRLEAGPMAVVARWTERLQYPAANDAFVAVAPGLTAAISEELRLGATASLTGSMRFLWSGSFGERSLGQYSSGTYEGVSAVLYQVGFEIRP